MPAGFVEIQVNGKTRQVAEGTTVAALIAELGLGGKPIAVEKNREVIPKAQHVSTTLADGDRVELVTFVGGG